MSEKDIYIGETSIQIGEHGFINQPKEIIEYIKYLQNQLQQEEQEIKRLNKERNKLYENGLNYFLELQEKKDEIERLNNTIKILEKYVIDEQISKYGDTLEEAEEYLEKLKRS